MRTLIFLLLAVDFCRAGVGVRILLGVNESKEAQWGGSITASGARIASLEGWRFEGNDAILPDRSFSRYVVGWMVAPREGAELAKQLIEETIGKHQIPADQLNIHADRGKVMTSKAVAFLMADLGVTKTHSRPYVSDDNPYSESQFRTMKYRPEFPDRFGCIQDSRAFCRQFFHWYNQEHCHSGIAMLTPAVVHFGEAPAVLAHRQEVLDAAYQAHPERFVRRPPKPLPLPQAAWINKPVPVDPKTEKAQH